MKKEATLLNIICVIAALVFLALALVNVVVFSEFSDNPTTYS